MRLFTTVAGLRAYLDRQPRDRVGLVPTMGALHAGHVSLIEQAIADLPTVVVSIFVNPLQFGPTEDLQHYPRQLDRDFALCKSLGVAAVFAPSPAEMGIESDRASTEEFATTTAIVPPDSLRSGLCGAFRPGHFVGVATIVGKLLHIVQPAIAYFGQKDAQQLAIIRRTVADLALPTTIKACPIVRESSGLALSSRNQYLSESQRSQAAQLYASLRLAEAAFAQGERDGDRLRQIVCDRLTDAAGVQVQYVALVHPDTLAPLTFVEECGLLAIAATVGSTRLIDNLLLRDRQPIIAIDGPAGAGKSTVTRQVAERLHLLYLDTGSMYRAIAWKALQSHLNLDDEGAIAEMASQTPIEISPRPYPQPPQVSVDGHDVSEAIRTPAVTAQVSKIAAQKGVRQILVRYQQQYGRRGGIVAEGRDIGTHVFPDAELKIFLTASVQERARRRWQEYQEKGYGDSDRAQLADEIAHRDRLDSERQFSPLRKAADAIELSTDGLTVEDVIEKIVHLYRQQVVRPEAQS